MTKKEIDKIVSDLIQEVGSDDIYDIISFLDIKIKKYGSKTFYYKVHDNKHIVLDEDVPDELEAFVLAHEVGHSILHDEEIYYYSSLIVPKTRIEREADYFAFKLLGKEIDLSYDFTTEQYAKMLGVNEEIIKYILK
jgi:Zn-dependent peptidase ImmA (M78 family)